MGSEAPLTLGFDTSAAHCAAALLRGSEVAEVTAEDMARGQAERLMPMIEAMLARARASWRDLDRLGVGVGPGNFTGIRIAVAAARGLALALDIRAVGVDAFSAISAGHDAPHLPVLPAPRGMFYARPPGAPPALMTPDAAAASGLPLADALTPADLAMAIARIAAAAPADGPPPAPLYIRPADAAPAREAPPAILD